MSFKTQTEDTNPQIKNLGFTVIELLVVISILAIVTTLIIANIAQQRLSQRLKIAQNELVTNLGKLQSNTLSSRQLASGQQVQYYILKIDENQPTQYTVQAMYDVNSTPQLVSDVETIKLPDGIRFASSNPISIYRPVIPIGTTTPSCALIAYKLPFSKMLFSNDCKTSGFSNPTDDDYKNILNFVINVPNAPGSNVSADSQMTIRLSNAEGNLCRSVIVYGMSGTFVAKNNCN